MSEDLLARVAKLIALAGSPEREEARTAAHKACEMIREHGLVVTFTVVDRAAPRNAHRPCPVCGAGLVGNQEMCVRCSRTHNPSFVIECAQCGRNVRASNAAAVQLTAEACGFRTTTMGKTLCSSCH